MGTWQQIVLVDFDNRARDRTVVVQVLGEQGILLMALLGILLRGIQDGRRAIVYHPCHRNVGLRHASAGTTKGSGAACATG